MTILPFVNIIIFLLVIASLTKYISTLNPTVTGYLYAIFFPTMLIVGLCLTSGVYMITAVQDREDGLRNLLNYGGMQSSAYFLGIVIADWIIFTIPCFLFTSIIWIIDISILKSRAAELFGALWIFGLPFCVLNNFYGFSYKSV